MMRFCGLGDNPIIATVDPTFATGPSFTGEPVATQQNPMSVSEAALASLPIYDVSTPTPSSLSLAAAAATPQITTMLLWGGAILFGILLLAEIRR